MHRLLLSALGLLLAFAAAGQAPADCLSYSQALETAAPFKLSGTTIGSKDGKYDMSWLDKEIKAKRGILIGESHWMNTVHNMAKDLVFRANEVDYYPVLILELPYSVGVFINDYINCQGAACDEAYKIIKPYYSTKEGLAFLNDLKAWNAAHPQKKITVVCSDIEQGYVFPLLNLYIPYFEALGVHDLKERVNTAKDVTPQIYAYMDSVLKASPANTVVKGKPYLTKAKALEVFDSFTAFYQAIQAERKSGQVEDFMKIRAQGIYDNLTSPAKIGGLITKHKFILWGGSAHVRIYQFNQDDFPKSEGWRLAHEYAPLKGKLLSVSLDNLAFGIPQKYITSEVYKKGTSQFASLVDSYKSCNQTAEEYEMLGTPTPLMNALLPNFRKNQDQPIWLKGNGQMAKLVKKSPGLEQDSKLKLYYSFDYVVVLPYATLFERLD